MRRCLRSRFGSLLVFGLVFLAVSLILRTVLLVHSAGNISFTFPTLAKMYLMGLLFDVLTWLCLVLPVAVLLVLLPDRVLRWKPVRIAAVVVYSLAVFGVLFDSAAEWFFWDEFGHRFNFIAVDYLVYTQELVGNIWESYPVVPVILGIVALAAAVVLATRKLLLWSYDSTSTFPRRLGLGAGFLVVPVLTVLLVRPSLADVSGNHYVNELSKNGCYSMFAAFFENIIEYKDFYPTADEKEVFARLRELVRTDNSRFVDDEAFSIARTITCPGEEKRYNVMVVVVESLSTEFLGAFGNPKGLTPRLDAVAGESLVFRNLYASGTRTDRGLEAITLSIPPTPGRSVLKRANNAHMFTLGSVLQQRGYHTRFIYGGLSYFDNMNAFFGGNGFEIIDGPLFPAAEVTFKNAWGLCDEDVLRRAVGEADKSFAQGKPFLSIIMTTSNHRPYTYPQKIDIPSGSGRDGAIKYTDYAIGDFLDQARSRPWFSDTIFVIVADHCANVAGRAEVPVARYHIPLLVYCPAHVQPGQVDALCSQIDLAPTILGLLNVSYVSRFYGKDVLREDPKRALLGNYQKLGLLTENTLTLLEPNRKRKAYRVDGDDNQAPTAVDKTLVRDAISYYQSASYLLEHRRDTGAPPAP